MSLNANDKEDVFREQHPEIFYPEEPQTHREEDLDFPHSVAGTDDYFPACVEHDTDRYTALEEDGFFVFFVKPDGLLYQDDEYPDFPHIIYEQMRRNKFIHLADWVSWQYQLQESHINLAGGHPDYVLDDCLVCKEVDPDTLRRGK